ncbi:hypothetical protein PFISCL1PPCAC_19336, partial [Pristionchus fissidentatus]
KVDGEMRQSIRLLTGGIRYVQGASVEGTREYFYYVSHEGRLFLDDTKHKNFTSSYKDVAFLNFFYRMLKTNETGKWNEFPFMSRCGVERNFLRCDDRPLVFTRLTMNGSEGRLKLGESSIEIPFEPSSLSVGSNGRLYHPSRLQLGLLTSKLADELFPLCRFDENARAVEINWKGEKYPISYV